MFFDNPLVNLAFRAGIVGLASFFGFAAFEVTGVLTPWAGIIGGASLSVIAQAAKAKLGTVTKADA